MTTNIQPESEIPTVNNEVQNQIINTAPENSIPNTDLQNQTINTAPEKPIIDLDTKNPTIDLDTKINLFCTNGISPIIFF